MKVIEGPTGIIWAYPICQTPGCGRWALRQRWNKNGTPGWRKWCQECHDDKTAARYAAKTPGASWVKTVNDVVAHKNGFNNLTDYLNSKHPYRQHRKNYCENINGSLGLGYNCTTTIAWEGMLDVDHIDGDPSNNDPSNLQTLCKCCHAHKTNEKRDFRSPGRKAMGIK